MKDELTRKVMEKLHSASIYPDELYRIGNAFIFKRRIHWNLTSARDWALRIGASFPDCEILSYYDDWYGGPDKPTYVVHFMVDEERL